MRGYYEPNNFGFESATDRAMREYNEELGKNALEENVAHIIANIMVDILKELQWRKRIGSAIDSYDGDAMAELEASICEKIESHVVALSEDINNEAHDVEP